ncbi:MAG: Rrf2 family transcriptional regulator [Dehalococcoidales bacterium]|nr:Rrf2 family transcriptional regulator [Dehalococcoidales bacterium]
MLVSTRGRYALRIMVELSRHDRDKYISLPVIALNQGVSEKYLESIISILVKEKMVEGLRGKGGGYRLCRELKDYSVGEILRLTEGSLAPVSCPVLGDEECPRADHCSTLPVWVKLDKLINDYLDSVTLADIISESVEKKS